MPLPTQYPRTVTRPPGMPLVGGQVLGKATQNQLKPRSEGFLSEDRKINRPTFPSDIGGTRRGSITRKCAVTELI